MAKLPKHLLRSSASKSDLGCHWIFGLRPRFLCTNCAIGATTATGIATDKEDSRTIGSSIWPSSANTWCSSRLSSLYWRIFFLRIILNCFGNSTRPCKLDCVRLQAAIRCLQTSLSKYLWKVQDFVTYAFLCVSNLISDWNVYINIHSLTL